MALLSHGRFQPGEDDLAEDSSPKSDDDVDEEILNDHSEIVEDEMPIDEEDNTVSDKNDDNQNDAHVTTVGMLQRLECNETPRSNVFLESTTEDEIYDASGTDLTGPGHSTLCLSKKFKNYRAIEVDEKSGTRSFRDQTGRRRFVCTQAPCAVMLKRQSDLFCRRHITYASSVDTAERDSEASNRFSAPSRGTDTTTQLLSTFPTEPTPAAPVVAPTNGKHQTESEAPKAPPSTGTNRSFRDPSGRIRFLCSNPTCHRRVPRRSETFCRRHQPDGQEKESGSHLLSNTTNSLFSYKTGRKNVHEMDVNRNNTGNPAVLIPADSFMKRRKYDNQPSTRLAVPLSSIPANKIVISSTTLLDDQWASVIQFLREFPQVQLSTNLNVTNATTHLLIDDTENHLHCTITKKIVQAAARRHLFMISIRWINECLQYKAFVDEHPYEIKSDTHTTLRLSRQDFQSTSKYLFDSNALNTIYGFAIECRQCQGSINRHELIELIELSGGKFYEHDRVIDLLVVLCDINEKNLDKIKDKYRHETVSSIKYVTSDFLLKSIIKFEIQDIDKYSL